VKDLVVLVADGQARAVLEAVLARWQALGLPAALDVEVVNIAGTDGGVRTQGAAVMARFASQCRHGLVLFDHEGCGSDEAAELLERELERQARTAWGERLACVVLEPELEEWLTGATRAFPEVEELAGVDVPAWWARHGFPLGDRHKPRRVKEAMEAVFHAHDARRSAANYRLIARLASLRLDRCQSRSFRRFVEALRRWFAPA